MTDRQLLEDAARAAGLAVYWYQREAHECWGEYRGCLMVDGVEWNPLEASGQALELAVGLRMDLHWTRDSRDRVVAMIPGAVSGGENSGGDPMAATRLAIVRAAAEIGKGMAHD